MKQQDNQSIITQGVIKTGSDIALEDLNVQNADAVKGGEVKPQTPIEMPPIVVTGERPKPKPKN
ncbi:MAG: hypothetical protein HOP19_20140 [Acidobacteria bacterium]|nr:hypothetical protein [Acidobacteriota bacterium]